MELARPFLSFVSILLFGWLFMSNTNFINVAMTLSKDEINSEVINKRFWFHGYGMDQLKKFTIEKISSMEVIRKRFSENAMIRVAVISIPVFIQIILYSIRGHVLNSKSLEF